MTCSARAIAFLLAALPPALTNAGAATVALAPGVTLVPGHAEPGRQPDGNSVLIATRKGYVVVDTGRRRRTRRNWSTWRARMARRSWPSSTRTGTSTTCRQPAVQRGVPGIAVYASNAIEGAMAGSRGLPQAARAEIAKATGRTVGAKSRAEDRAHRFAVARCIRTKSSRRSRREDRRPPHRPARRATGGDRGRHLAVRPRFARARRGRPGHAARAVLRHRMSVGLAASARRAR